MGDGRYAYWQVGTPAPPGLNGFELTKHLRDSPLTAHIPVIMITAEESYHSKAEAAGVDVLLGKPYSDEIMISHIQRFMLEGRTSFFK